MSSITIGDSRRIQSKMNNARGGFATPEEILYYTQNTAAAGAIIVMVNPGGYFKIVDIWERHSVAGGAGSKILLKVHDAGVVAAPGAATSGITIWQMASVAADTTANTWQKKGSAGVVWNSSPGNRANGQAVPAQILGPGDTLILDIPASPLNGIFLQIMGVYI